MAPFPVRRTDLSAYWVPQDMMQALQASTPVASEHVTIFGGTGFLGRQVVKLLIEKGASIRVAVRHPEPDGGFERERGEGQIECLEADVCDETSVARAVAGSHAVVNAVGHYVEAGPATFDAIHAQGALHVARQAGQAGVQRLIHVSGLGANPASKSSYIRARGIGEARVKEAFDGVTILRPCVIFGHDDAFLNTLASLARSLPALPLFGRGDTRLQPVFVQDVAKACVKAIDDPSTAGKVFELGGPKVYSYRELVELVQQYEGSNSLLLPLPFLLWDVMAIVSGFLANPPLTRDQVALMKQDKVVGSEALGLSDLGITPIVVEVVLASCIAREP